MQDKDLQHILAELGLDPHDKQLQSLLKQIAVAKPQVLTSESFKQELRQELMQRISAGTPVAVSQPTSQPVINSSKVMSKFMIPVFALVILLVAGGVWYNNQNSGLINLGGSKGQLLSDQYSVDELSANSFGDLSKVVIVAAANKQGGSNATADSATGSQTAMAGSTSSLPPVATEPGSGGGTDAAIFPYPSGFQFDYVGEEISGLPVTQSVLKRLQPEQNPSVVDQIVSFFSFGLIDLTQFDNPKIQNVAFVEDKDYGMSVNMDLSYGTVSLYQNWEKWPQPEYRCDQSYCGIWPRLTKDEIPTDEEAITIANQFITDYGVSTTGYGEPEVRDQMPWAIAAMAEDRAMSPFSESVTVLYPLELEGQAVLDESGNPTGMMLNIDVRSRKVNNLYGLESKQFQKSEYTGVTDAARIIAVAERGGYRSGGWDVGTGAVTLELDTPSVQLVRIWYASEPTKQGDELYVPCLVFPIKNAPENNYWRQNVIVPLVKDLLDNENPSGGPVMPLDQPTPEPMPVEPDGGTGETPPDQPVSTEPAPPVTEPATDSSPRG